MLNAFCSGAENNLFVSGLKWRVLRFKGFFILIGLLACGLFSPSIGFCHSNALFVHQGGAWTPLYQMSLAEWYHKHRPSAFYVLGRSRIPIKALTLRTKWSLS